MSDFSQQRLRHPNVMSEAERLALPDPCRPIDSPVKPAGVSLNDYLTGVTTDNQGRYIREDQNLHSERQSFVSQYTTNQSDKKLAQRQEQIHHNEIDNTLSCFATHDILAFIREQQQLSQTKPCQLRLPLTLVPKMVRDGGKDLIEMVMKSYPDFIFHNNNEQQPCDGKSSFKLSPDNHSDLATSIGDTNSNHHTNNNAKVNLETRLYMMGQMYHLMLCVFLLCQCKARKTLNHQITLQDLTDAINAYINAHRIEIGFASHQPDLTVNTKHLEFALLAMQWQMSHHDNLDERVTIISTNNPLTGC